MARRVSVVIPALDEELRIGVAIASAFAAGAFEVLVSDGGSRDATCAAARAQGARLIEGETMRSRQLNRGAEAATGDCLLFLHADTRLPPDACAAATEALDAGSTFGGFQIDFVESSFRLRLAAMLINFRTRLTRCPWGDQAQFIDRDLFLRNGGFREIAIMEDYDLAVRMKNLGSTAILSQRVQTSGRRFLERGLLRTAMRNWRIIAAWRRGADPEGLAALYRGR